MLIVECTQCGGEVVFDAIPEMGEKIVCRNCHISLEIVWLYPLDLDIDEHPVIQPIASMEEEQPK